MFFLSGLYSFLPSVSLFVSHITRSPSVFSLSLTLSLFLSISLCSSLLEDIKHQGEVLSLKYSHGNVNGSPASLTSELKRVV